MAQPVTSIILAGQGELAAKARRFTEGANEASLLVGCVISKALAVFPDADADKDAIVNAMQRELDRLIEQLRKARS